MLQFIHVALFHYLFCRKKPHCEEGMQIRTCYLYLFLLPSLTQATKKSNCHRQQSLFRAVLLLGWQLVLHRGLD